ncbi:hypothetical protein DKX38_030168 [Salix brachista]|uniref:Retrotransposon Copia-like N-terminal domain-containing protein n=1 Tax=Salix brachista TaxID=2182728 RepID=A0A5N5IWN0_9ROSI|nr:hypothetical protein DKX38_030168 [Salix brachista]
MTTPTNDDGVVVKNTTVTLPSLHMQDVSSLLTPDKLDGTNYVEWALNAQNKIRGRKRWGFISGTKVAPNDTNSEEYEAWEDDNCLIKSWLLDAMNKDIRSIFLRLPTAKEIWDMAKQTYSVSQDASKSYQLYCEVISVRQNGSSVIYYWGKLQKLWQEMDAIDDCAMSCKADIEIYTTKVNSQRVYIFLAGLDSSLDGVRGRVLATVPLPNLQVTYAMVCAEANRQDAMMGGISTDGTAMATRRISTRQDNKKGTRKCTHCNGDNHVVDTCFKLHGYPEWHPKGKKTFANANTSMQQPVASTAGLTAQTDSTPTCTEDVRYPANREEVLSFDIKLTALPTSIPADENNTTMDTPTAVNSCLQDKTMDTSTTNDPCSQDSNEHYEQSHQPLDSTLPPNAPANSSPESLSIPTPQRKFSS